jgi:putative two-component system response regulator
VCQSLDTNGFVSTSRESAEEALSALQGSVFDLVITDIFLGSNGSGTEVAKAACALDPAVPVILLTGKPSMDSAVEGLRSRVYDYITKPVDERVLLGSARRAVDDARLRRQNKSLREVNQLLASILPNAIEAKDPTTRGHSDRVVHYALRMADLCGIAEEDIQELRMAALLHDIGKIGIPGSILTKEGPLTKDERRKIQEHPEIGYKILAPMDCNRRARDWVYQHHERWDGRGYPCQLRGEEVALPGRILIVAEVYDALATARSYKEAWPVARIAEFLQLEAGHHFDPEIAHLLADGLRRIGRSFVEQGSGSLFS